MKEWIKNLYNKEQGKTILKLSLYMIFFIIVFLLIVVVSRTSNLSINNIVITSSSIDSNNVETITYLDKQNKLIYGEYSFVYTVSGSKKITYMGTYNNQEVEGLRETEDEIIRYSIEDDITYLKTLNSKEVYTSLYDGLDSELFSMSSLFSKLNMTSGIINQTVDGKIYNYEDEMNRRIQVITDNENILEINIWTDTYSCVFTFEY